MLKTVFVFILLVGVSIDYAKAHGQDFGLSLLDWDRFEELLVARCKAEYPDTVDNLKIRMTAWKSENKPIIKKLIELYKTEPVLTEEKINILKNQITSEQLNGLNKMSNSNLKGVCLNVFDMYETDFSNLLRRYKKNNERMVFLDWDRYGELLVERCSKEFPETLDDLEKNMEKWKMENKPIIEQIIKIYRDREKTSTQKWVDKNRNSITKNKLRKLSEMSNPDLNITCLYRFSDSKLNFSNLLRQLQK